MMNNRILWLCNGGMICVAYGAALIPVYLTTFSETFGGLDESELGQISATLFAGAMVGIFVSGPLADRLGAKLFTVGGSVLCCAGLVVLAAAQDYWSLLVASGLMGFAAGILDMILSPIIAAVRVNDRAKALNRLHAFYCFGAISTIAISSVGLRFGLGWQPVCLSLTILPAALAIGFAITPSPPLVHPDQQRQRLRELLRSPRFYAGLIAIALVGATEEGMAQWLPAFAERELGYTKATAGAALGFYAVGMGVGRLGGERFVERIGTHRLVIIAAAFCGLMFVTGAASPIDIVALSACALVGLGCSVLWPTNLGIAADRMPHGGATLFAAMAAAGNAGCVVAPWAEGVIAEYATLRTALIAGSTFPFTLAAIMIFIRRCDVRTSRQSVGIQT